MTLAGAAAREAGPHGSHKSDSKSAGDWRCIDRTITLPQLLPVASAPRDSCQHLSADAFHNAADLKLYQEALEDVKTHETRESELEMEIQKTKNQLKSAERRVVELTIKLNLAQKASTCVPTTFQHHLTTKP